MELFRGDKVGHGPVSPGPRHQERKKGKGNPPGGRLQIQFQGRLSDRRNRFQSAFGFHGDAVTSQKIGRLLRESIHCAAGCSGPGLVSGRFLDLIGKRKAHGFLRGFVPAGAGVDFKHFHSFSREREGRGGLGLGCENPGQRAFDAVFGRIGKDERILFVGAELQIGSGQVDGAETERGEDEKDEYHDQGDRAGLSGDSGCRVNALGRSGPRPRSWEIS